MMNPNHHSNEEYYLVKDSNTFFSFQLIYAPSLSIYMIEGDLQSGKENAINTETTTKKMTSMNEAIAFIVQLVHQKALEGYKLANASTCVQYKELSIKDDNASEMPLEIAAEELSSPCNIPSKGLDPQTEYLLVADNVPRSEGKSDSDDFEVIESKESEGDKDQGFQQENDLVEICLSSPFVEKSFKITDLQQKEFELPLNEGIESQLESEEISISTFHRVNKEAILKKAEELNIKCDFRYYMMIISGLNQNINEFKNYLYQVEVSTKEALYPKYWDLKDTNMYSEIEVAHDSQEFEEIISLMTETLIRDQITRLVRIQNNYLMTHYITNLNMRQEVNPKKITKELLFQSTNQVEPSKIYKSFDTGFDFEYPEDSVLFGKGPYFVHTAYSNSIEEQKYQLIFADVFVGKSYTDLDLKNIIKPPEGYDSLSLRNEFYILSNNFHSCPLYLVEYTMKNAIDSLSPSQELQSASPPTRATKVHKLDFTPINHTLTNTDMNNLSSISLQIEDTDNQAFMPSENPPLATKKSKTERLMKILSKNPLEYLYNKITHSDSSTSSNNPTNAHMNYLAPPPLERWMKLFSNIRDWINNFDSVDLSNSNNTDTTDKRLELNKVLWSTKRLNRIKNEIRDINSDPSLDFLYVEQPDEKDLSRCILCVLGPIDSPYEGGIFNVEIIFPDDYPMNPPLVNFKTKIYHPSIDDAGHICLGILDQWIPAGTLKQIGLIISALLSNPLLENALRHNISYQYQIDRQSFVLQARAWTKKYAE